MSFPMMISAIAMRHFGRGGLSLLCAWALGVSFLAAAEPPEGMPKAATGWVSPAAPAALTALPPPPVVTQSEPERWATPWSWFNRSQPVARLGAAVLEAPPAWQGRTVPSDYRLQPGDQVRIVAWGGAPMNLVVPVDASGNLGLPEHGVVPVAGRTAGEAQALAIELLRSHFKNAGCVISVERPSATAITVTGEVLRPGTVLVPPGGTVIDALAAAGSVAPQGTMRGVRVSHPGAAPHEVDLYAALLEGDLSRIQALPPGTAVYVPMAGPQVTVFGAARRVPRPDQGGASGAAVRPQVAPAAKDVLVTRELATGPNDKPVFAGEALPTETQVRSRPSVREDPDTVAGLRIELKPGDTLAAALALAGGPSGEADLTAIRLVREGGQGQNLAQHAAADLAAIPAQDGDRLLLVPRSILPQGRLMIQISGAVRTPGIYGHAQGLTLAAVLAIAGGALPEADPASIVIRRTLATPQEMAVAPGLNALASEQVVSGRDPATVLQPGDVIVVPVRPPLGQQILNVSIEGAVQHPGSVPLAPGMTVRDLVNLAGGLAPDAAAESADLVRSVVGPTGQVTVGREAVDLKAILAGAPGPVLTNRDALVVRRRANDRIRVQLRGELTTPGDLVLPTGATLTTVLSVAGGFTQRAFPQGGRLYRNSERMVQEEHLKEMTRRLSSTVGVNQRRLTGADNEPDKKALEASIANQQAELVRMQTASATGRMAGVRFADALTGAEGSDIPLADGDLIEIPPIPHSIRVVGEVMAPGSTVFEAGQRPADIISRSGGFTRQADRDYLFVVRADGSVVATEGRRGSAWDPQARQYVRTSVRSLVLQDGDTIVVPPDLSFHPSGMTLLKDWSTVVFQLATAAGTVAVLNK